MILIKLSAGRMYADILGAMRKFITPEESRTIVYHIRKMVTGGVLLTLVKIEPNSRWLLRRRLAKRAISG